MPGSLDPGRVKQEQSPGEDGKKTHVTVNLLSAEMASIQSNEAVKHFVYFHELSKKIKLIEIIFNNKTTVYITRGPWTAMLALLKVEETGQNHKHFQTCKKS